RLQRADLIEDEAADLLGRVTDDLPAAEAPEIEEARMRADGDAARLGERDRPMHHLRIAAMEAASDIRRRDDLQHRRIVADRVGAEALAHIGVEIDRHAHGSLPEDNWPMLDRRQKIYNEEMRR